MNLLVARQLDTTATGSATNLKVFLRAARKGGLATRILFAPRRSFGNRPWFDIHRDFSELATHAGCQRRQHQGR